MVRHKPLTGMFANNKPYLRGIWFALSRRPLLFASSATLRRRSCLAHWSDPVTKHH